MFKITTTDALNCILLRAGPCYRPIRQRRAAFDGFLAVSWQDTSFLWEIAAFWTSLLRAKFALGKSKMMG